MPAKPYEAIVVCDSISEVGRVRLTTLEVTFPRIVLAEFNTHRVMSRNSASSRAIPVEKRIAQVRQNPYVPLQFGKNKRGMQAEDAEVQDRVMARNLWLNAQDCACDMAASLAELGVHKQWANRLIEPFAWHTVVVTATEWDNFFALRISEHAQPEIQKAAEAMRAAMDESAPAECSEGDWHLPYIQDDERGGAVSSEHLVKLSAARCARVSYLTHDGTRSHHKDLELYERLASAGHMSPLEHPAKVGTQLDLHNVGLRYPAPESGAFIGNFRAPWIQHRKMIPGEAVFRG